MSLYYLFVILCSIMTLTNITANVNSIPMLSGSNIKSWQENLLIVLIVIGLDLALRVDSPCFLWMRVPLMTKRK